MKIIYLSRSFPYTEVEAFLTPEITALTRHGHEVLIVPRSPKRFIVHGDAQPMVDITRTQALVSLEIIKAALAEVRRSPIKAVKALSLLMRSRNANILMKNLAVYTKGLWLAQIASEVSEVPWSFTAHRHDIVANNLLALKIRKASFGRFISQSGLELARSLAIKGIEEKAQLLHMGVNLSAVAAGAVRQGGNSVVFCPANLIPVKGHKYLIEAVAILKGRGVEVALWVAGEGELR